MTERGDDTQRYEVPFPPTPEPPQAPGEPSGVPPSDEPSHAPSSGDPDGSAAPRPEPPASPPVAASVRALPLSGRRLLPVSLDLLVRAERPLRTASFYIGFLLAVMVAPAVALFTAATLALGDAMFDPFSASQAWAAWLGLAALVAVVGVIVASVESRVLATAIIAATIEERPLLFTGVLALARRRFWGAATASALISIPAVIGQNLGSGIAEEIAGPSAEIAFAASAVGGVLLAVPFVYAVAGVVLGEVGALEAVRRSIRLFAARPGLAVLVTAFGLVSQFVLLFAVSAGADITLRVFEVLGVGPDVPVPAAIGVSIALVFAFGTLLFLAEAIAATPQVHAFVALTHYVRGLEPAREPAAGTRGLRGWLTRGLIAAAIVAIGSFVLGIGSLA